jgi:hypothetical protein
MTRRLVASVLWFVAISSLVTFAETLLGQPRQFGSIVGVVAAGYVFFDPMGVVWSRRHSLSWGSTPRRVVRVDPPG